MNIIILLIFISFVGISFTVGKKDILSPWFMLCSMFLFCYLIVLLNTKNWEVQYHYFTAILFICGISSWGLGSIAVKRVKKIYRTDNFEMETVKKFPIKTLSLLSMIIMTIYILRSISFSFQVTYEPGFSNMLRTIYDLKISGNHMGFVTNQLFIIAQAIAYIDIFAFLNKEKENFKLAYVFYGLPIVSYLFCIVFSTERNPFIMLCIYIMAVWIMTLQNKRNPNMNLKIIGRLVIALFIVIIVFFILGKTKNYQSDFTKAISIYIGSGLYGFDMYIDKIYDGILSHGSETFNSIIYILNKFGIGLNLKQVLYEDFIGHLNSEGYYFSTNIYSAFKRYLADFGVIGVIVLTFIQGLFFELLYQFKCSHQNSQLGRIYYAALIYAILYCPIMELFYTELHFGTVYRIVWLYIIYKITIGKKTKFKFGSR